MDKLKVIVQITEALFSFVKDFFAAASINACQIY